MPHRRDRKEAEEGLEGRSQPYSGNMFRNCFTPGGVRAAGRETRGRQREDKNVSSFLRAGCRASRCFLPRRGVTFAGCDVENWIQVWGGM